MAPTTVNKFELLETILTNQYHGENILQILRKSHPGPIQSASHRGYSSSGNAFRNVADHRVREMGR
jgi:hypothetical protein